MPNIHPNYFAVYHKECGYNEQFKNTDTWVAGYNTETKTARPTHGYFPTHSTGLSMKKFFTKIGYTFNYS